MCSRSRLGLLLLLLLVMHAAEALVVASFDELNAQHAAVRCDGCSS